MSTCDIKRELGGIKMNYTKRRLWTFRILFGLTALVGAYNRFFVGSRAVWSLLTISFLISLVCGLYYEGAFTQSKSNTNKRGVK